MALGVAPIATGGDGGGSIRIPAALNGVFGIKPTFGRVSRAGDGFKGSVAHAGPLACSHAPILALFLDAVAVERRSADELTAWAPPPPAGGFGALLGAGVRGLRIGVDEDEWRDASEPVARACREALRALEREGAVLVDISLPIAHHAAKIGYLTIGPESLAAHRREWLEQRELLGDDLRLAFAVLSGFTALEQLDAQRLRAGLRRELAHGARAASTCIALPTTAITAPRYTEEDAKTSFSDPGALDGALPLHLPRQPHRHPRGHGAGGRRRRRAAHRPPDRGRRLGRGRRCSACSRTSSAPRSPARCGPRARSTCSPGSERPRALQLIENDFDTLTGEPSNGGTCAPRNAAAMQPPTGGPGERRAVDRRRRDVAARARR